MVNCKWAALQGEGSTGPRKITRIAHERLQAAFTALGLDRVVAGVRSLYMERRGWDDCFLAMAYGEEGELDHTISVDDPVTDSLETEETVSHLFGIDIEHVDVIVHRFDADPDTFTAELVEWLQARNVNAATVLAETCREVETDRQLGSPPPREVLK